MWTELTWGIRLLQAIRPVVVLVAPMVVWSWAPGIGASSEEPPVLVGPLLGELR